MKSILHLSENWQVAIFPSIAAKGLVDISKLPNEQKIKAKVPGCIELDLVANYMAKDPYFSQNPYDFRYLEEKDFLYSIEINADENDLSLDTIHFSGIDTIADIFLNGEKIGRTENMFLEYDFPISLQKGTNLLQVYIYSPLLYVRKFDIPAFCNAQKFNYETLYIRKIASMYGWDILPRFVSAGIYKQVYLYKKKTTALKNIGLFTTKLKNTEKAELRLTWSFDTQDLSTNGYQIEVEGVCGESSFQKVEDAYFTSGVINIDVVQPKLWFPRNYGEPNLYEIHVKLLKDNKVLDEQTFPYGIRQVELVRTSTTTKDGDGEFCFKINNQKIFVLGTNWVPLDAFPCRYEERMQEALEELKDVGCNTVRVWGGGSYQSEEFYQFCDQNGIMVWQDFCLGCATYPNDEYFANAIREEATYIVKKLRNHASIVLWAGDNECDEVPKWHRYKPDPNDNIITRKILPEVIRMEDYTRPYLPSSPFTDEIAYKTRQPLPEQHLWGPRDYFKGDFYKNDPCHFASEIGYHGCPSKKSLEKFISKESLYPFIDKDNIPNEDYICHASGVVKGTEGPYAYRIPLMKNQVITMFGNTVPDNLEDFAKASQISQAEAFKFFVEHFRIAKWRRTGIIWWNLLDGWPQISDAVIDWYHTKKLAYHYIKRSQEPFQLAFDEPLDGTMKLFAINDTQSDVTFTYEVLDITKKKVLCQGNATVNANTSLSIDSCQELQDYHFLLLKTNMNGQEMVTHFATKVKDISYPQYLKDLQEAHLDTFEGF